MRYFVFFILVIAFAVLTIATAKADANNKYGEFPSDTLKTPTRWNVADSAEIRYLALGDSYTIGEWVKPHERFPAQVAVSLRVSGIRIKDPVYVATSGWTSQDLIAAINGSHLKPEYDLVTLLIGVNDQYRGMDTSAYRTRFAQLLTSAVRLAAGRRKRVFVLSIPDYSVTPFVGLSSKQAVRSEVDYFNAINRQVTLKYKVAYIDVTVLSREAENDPALIARDGLHFSGLQYRKWSAKLQPEMMKALGY